MILKEAEYERCGECRAGRLVTDAVLGCDNCEDAMDGVEQTPLEITIFNHVETGVEHDKSLIFCCWASVFKFLPTIENNHFVSLPTLNYDKDSTLGCRARLLCGGRFV